MFATRVVITSVAVLALTLLASCGKKEESKTSATTAPSAAPPVAQPAPPPVAPAPQAPAPQAAAPAAGAPALARSDGEKPGLSVEVTELKRGSGGTVTLKFALINNSKEQISLGYDYGDPATGAGDYSNVGGTHLMDAMNKKKYLVVRDSDKKCVCSTMKGYIHVGERANLWAKFPAPPDDVKVISIVIPHFAPMDDVPISN